MKNQAKDKNAQRSTRSLVPRNPRTPAHPLARASEHARRRQIAKAAMPLSSDAQAGSDVGQDAQMPSPPLLLLPGRDQASHAPSMGFSITNDVVEPNSPPPTDPTDPDPTQN